MFGFRAFWAESKSHATRLPHPRLPQIACILTFPLLYNIDVTIRTYTIYTTLSFCCSLTQNNTSNDTGRWDLLKSRVAEFEALIEA